MGDVVRRVARWRVPLGFLCAVVAFVLAQPTWTSWQLGLVVALLGETLRVWAAGHLEKSREVTASGPYRYVGHPLYLGSAVLTVGVVLAARSPVVAVLAAVYLGATITAAIRTEEAFLARAFAEDYASYRAGAQRVERRFSLTRAVRNREYRAVTGVAVGFALLALKIRLSL